MEIRKHKSFQHFVITRFNLRSKNSSWKIDKNKVSVIGMDWLEHRISIFKEICLPSMLNQSNKNFRWLLYFDTETPKKILDEFKGLELQYPFIHCIGKQSYESFISSYTADVSALCVGDETHVITTRLDNDDAVHKDFISTIQAHFRYQSFQALNFVQILVLNPELPSRLFIDYRFSTHFLSLFEEIKNGHLKGCYCKMDVEWKEEAQQVLDGRYCIEVITNRNLNNDFRGFPLFWKVNLNKYGLSGDTFKQSLFDPYWLKIWKYSWKKGLEFLMKKYLN